MNYDFNAAVSNLISDMLCFDELSSHDKQTGELWRGRETHIYRVLACLFSHRIRFITDADEAAVRRGESHPESWYPSRNANLHKIQILTAPDYNPAGYEVAIEIDVDKLRDFIKQPDIRYYHGLHSTSVVVAQLKDYDFVRYVDLPNGVDNTPDGINSFLAGVSWYSGLFLEGHFDTHNAISESTI